MRVIGTVGLPGSGKGEAAAVAREQDVPVITMGDVIRQETADRGLDPAKDHGTVAQALRDEDGPTAVADRSLPMIRDRLEDHNVVLVDGIRSDVEVEVFEDAFGEDFTVLSIEAPREIRAERLTERGRDASATDGGEPLADRDERELGFGMGKAMEQADHVIENVGTLEAFRSAVRSVLEGGASNERRPLPPHGHGDNAAVRHGGHRARL